MRFHIPEYDIFPLHVMLRHIFDSSPVPLLFHMLFPVRQTFWNTLIQLVFLRLDLLAYSEYLQILLLIQHLILRSNFCDFLKALTSFHDKSFPFLRSLLLYPKY